MKIDRSAFSSTRVSALVCGDVFEFEESFYIVIDSPASDETCVDLDTGHFVLDFSRDVSDEPVRHLPDATLFPHGLEISES